MPYGYSVQGVVMIGIVLYPIPFGADAELVFAIHQERHALFSLVQFVVFPQVVEEEGLQHMLLFDLYGIDAVYKAGVVHHHTGGLLGEFLVLFQDK